MNLDGAERDIPVVGDPRLLDPCDGCGDTAAVVAVLPSGSALVLCGRCWRRNEAGLRDAAERIFG